MLPARGKLYSFGEDPQLDTDSTMILLSSTSFSCIHSLQASALRLQSSSAHTMADRFPSLEDFSAGG